MSATQQQAVRIAEEKGLYRRSEEHDACGVGFVANIKGRVSHDVIEQALGICAILITAAPWVPIPCAVTAPVF